MSTEQKPPAGIAVVAILLLLGYIIAISLIDGNAKLEAALLLAE